VFYDRFKGQMDTGRKQKLKEIPLDRQATYKQGWAVAYQFARDNINKFSENISEKGLATVFNAVIYGYHQDKGTFLTHGEVDDYLNGRKECPGYYLDRIRLGKSILEVPLREIKEVLVGKNGKNIDFDQCIKGLDEEHKTKLSWFMENKGKIKKWREIVPDYANGYKGIYKPKGSVFALSVRMSLSDDYEDSPIVYYEDESFLIEGYCFESSDASVNKKDHWTNKAIINNEKSIVPIGIIQQVKKKPGTLYRIHGPALAETIASKEVFKFLGFSYEGQIPSQYLDN